MGSGLHDGKLLATKLIGFLRLVWDRSKVDGDTPPAYLSSVPPIILLKVPQQIGLVSCGGFAATYVQEMMRAASQGSLSDLIRRMQGAGGAVD